MLIIPSGLPCQELRRSGPGIQMLPRDDRNHLIVRPRMTRGFMPAKYSPTAGASHLRR
jgi:hypothetical protein